MILKHVAVELKQLKKILRLVETIVHRTFPFQ
jgi:hypothetical protein